MTFAVCSEGVATESPTTWEEAALAVAATTSIGFVELCTPDATFDPLHDSELICDELRDDLKLDSDSEQSFIGLVENGLIGGLRMSGDGYDDGRISEALSNVVSTIISKQHDYGHDNILWGGVDGLVIRIHDKIARIKNLEQRGDAPSNESLLDSWLDVAGYGIIGAMLLNGTFLLPLADDLRKQDEANAADLEQVDFGDGFNDPQFVYTDGNGHTLTVTAESDRLHVGTKNVWGDGGYGPSIKSRVDLIAVIGALYDGAEALGWV